MRQARINYCFAFGIIVAIGLGLLAFIRTIRKKEGLENWSDPAKNENAAKDVVISNKFEGAVANQYHKPSIIKYAK